MPSTTTTATPRGQARRLQILEAAVRLLASEGPAGLTHRRVASEAGVPLAATTYYFGSKDALLGDALRLVATREIGLLQSRAAELGEAFTSPAALGQALAAVLVDQLARERDAVITKFELYLESARRGSLRTTSRHWIAGFTALAEEALRGAGAPDPAATARLLVAGADGLLLHQLATAGRRADLAPLAERLEALVEALLP